MDNRFLHLYNIELQHLRQTAREFAQAYPKVAGRLALDRDSEDVCPDPFVERLLEGFAFLTARVQHKLDAEFPRFTQAVLETVYPHFLTPTPSLAVVQFEPDAEQGALPAGLLMPRGTALRTPQQKGGPPRCEYRTAHPVCLYPLRVVEARYFAEDTVTLDLPESLAAKAAIRLRLETTSDLPWNELKLDSLTFFLRGPDEVPVQIYEEIFARGTGAVVQSATKPVQRLGSLPAEALQRVGFRDAEALLPAGPRSFQGYRLLREYFAMPDRFLFVEVRGLGAAAQRCADRQLDIVIGLKERQKALSGRVQASCFALFCTPAVNLFPKELDRVALSNRFAEFHLVPDVTRPLDFEIFEVQRVTAYDQHEQEQPFQPFYLARDQDEAVTPDQRPAAYYTVNRLQRALTEQETAHGRRSSYLGSELFISLVDAKSAPYSPDLQSLGIKALVTNRHLPMQLAVGVNPTDFVPEAPGIKAIRCLSGPTPPRPSPAEGEVGWRLISHLTLNYLSLLDGGAEEGASALREILRLYGDLGDPDTARQIEGVRSVQAEPIVRRVENPGPIAYGEAAGAPARPAQAAEDAGADTPRDDAGVNPPPITFARGLQVTVTFDEHPFAGRGVFLLGAVLEQFFARYTALNSFTETVIRTIQRREIIRWPARIGRRALL